MRVQNDAGQQRSALQRAIVLFCVLSLFVFVGIVLFLTPKVHASATHVGSSTTISTRVLTVITTSTPVPVATTPTTLSPTATDTPIPTPTDTPIPTPTDTPIPTPTDTPIPTPTDTPLPTPTDTPIPTPTDTPIPTPTATTVPTNTPTPVPGKTPTPVATPTSTSAAGVPLPGVTPTVGSTQQTTPTPTPSGMTATPSGSGLPPATTDVVPSPTANTYNTTVAAQNNGKLLVPTVPELAIGSSVLGVATVIAWLIWRRRQEALVSSTRYPLAQTPSAYNSSPMSYTQTALAPSTGGMVRENGPFYQEGTTMQAMAHMPETPLPHQAMMDSLEPSLETIMRQAQTGLFALPDKEVYS